MEAVWNLILAQARPEFSGLSETEVWRALAEEDGGATAAEVTRLAVDFFLRFKAYMIEKELPPPPPHIMHVRARCPIERVAVLLMVEYVQSESRAPPYVSLH